MAPSALARLRNADSRLSRLRRLSLGQNGGLSTLLPFYNLERLDGDFSYNMTKKCSFIPLFIDIFAVEANKRKLFLTCDFCFLLIINYLCII